MNTLTSIYSTDLRDPSELYDQIFFLNSLLFVAGKLLVRGLKVIKLRLDIFFSSNTIIMIFSRNDKFLSYWN